MDTNISKDNLNKIVRPVLIYGSVFLMAYILSEYNVEPYLIIFIAIIQGVIFEKTFKKRTKE